MTGSRILILGGGFGGLVAAQQLRRLLPSEHRIVVVEKRPFFYINAFNMQLITGEMKEPREGQRDLSELARRDIDWVHAEIERIEPAAKRVQTSSGAIEGDYIIVAMGSEKHPELVPGFAETACNLYEATGAVQLHERLTALEKGRIAIVCCATPFSCPGAPYEAAFLVDWILRDKQKRDRFEIDLYTPEPMPLPSTGAAMGEAVLAMFQDKHIGFHPKQRARRMDALSRTVIFETGEAAFDLLIGVPPHTAPRAVKEAGLADETGWVPVNMQTLETAYPAVFAVGDVTSIRQPNPTGFFVPKAAVFADDEARVVARNIASQILGQEASARFGGDGFCYLETGDGMAAYGSGNFFSYPGPRVYIEPPSARFLKERRDLERERFEALV